MMVDLNAITPLLSGALTGIMDAVRSIGNGDPLMLGLGAVAAAWLITNKMQSWMSVVVIAALVYLVITGTVV